MSILNRIWAGIARVVGVAHDIVEKGEQDIAVVIDAIIDIKPEEVARRLDAAVGDRNLDWRHSIVDLMKLVDGEEGSGFEARAHLWTEMGFAGPYGGTKQQNITLHAKVLETLSQRGLRFPDQAA